MTIGTKSLLFGAHQFILHPVFVFIGWWRLYGFPWDPRLWIAFVIHDWGYWGCPNMDGPEGKKHPIWAAVFMDRWFGAEWGIFCLLHSRSIANKYDVPPSRLCAADKLAFPLMPSWLYLMMARATGELSEYMTVWEDTFAPEAETLTPKEWHTRLGYRMWLWAAIHAGRSE